MQHNGEWQKPEKSSECRRDEQVFCDDLAFHFWIGQADTCFHQVSKVEIRPDKQKDVEKENHRDRFGYRLLHTVRVVVCTGVGVMGKVQGPVCRNGHERGEAAKKSNPAALRPVFKQQVMVRYMHENRQPYHGTGHQKIERKMQEK